MDLGLIDDNTRLQGWQVVSICGKNGCVTWIYLSPHLDDVALSCGGLVWEQVRSGQTVYLWTICAGDPPPGPVSPFAEALHARWKMGEEVTANRRAEDIRACRIMGVRYYHFSLPDCIYRRMESNNVPLYASEEAIFGPIHSMEVDLIQSLIREFSQLIRKLEIENEVRVVCPLTIGGHVDHRLTRAAAEAFFYPYEGSPGENEPKARFIPGSNFTLWYYADYPYVGKNEQELIQLEQAGWRPAIFPISKKAMTAWKRAAASYSSQLSTFWPDEEAMRTDLADYSQREGGLRLWQQF
jgi:LmbE family N-acetylglucosaminyl deacetylase